MLVPIISKLCITCTTCRLLLPREYRTVIRDREKLAAACWMLILCLFFGVVLICFIALHTQFFFMHDPLKEDNQPRSTSSDEIEEEGTFLRQSLIENNGRRKQTEGDFFSGASSEHKGLLLEHASREGEFLSTLISENREIVNNIER